MKDEYIEQDLDSLVCLEEPIDNWLSLNKRLSHCIEMQDVCGDNKELGYWITEEKFIRNELEKL